MIRYRLRFLMQEFDLPVGTTLLGRSNECMVTIEDPLVSRTHARVELANDVAIIHDLGSRNGLRINGALAPGASVLRHGDRIRIGSQELVFAVIETTIPSVKTTGFLRRCAQCGIPYPAEAGQCPNCGGVEFLDEDTLTGQRSMGPAEWQLALLVEMLERATSAGRRADIDRLLRRISSEFERGVIEYAPSAKDTEDLVLATARAAIATDSVQWAEWTAGAYAHIPHTPTESVLGSMRALATHFPSESVGWFARLSERFAAQGRAEAVASLVELATRVP